jgi:hypothetical protein
VSFAYSFGCPEDSLPSAQLAWTADRNAADHCSIGPSGVVDQSNAAIRCAALPAADSLRSPDCA